jgi:acid phosphatase (class A)
MRHQLMGAVVALGVIACADAPVAMDVAPPQRVGGYLPAEQLPDSARLLPPPPAADTAALAQDEEVQRGAFALRGTPRWDLAALDTRLRFPQAAENFSCALGVAVDAVATPRLYVLMERSINDAARSTGAAKRLYKRPRPFVKLEQPTCKPDDEPILRGDGSFPSGHAAAGMAVALVLAEVAPDRLNELLARGRSFGESRMVCNFHWQSDVIAGRHMAAATVARLQSQPEFQADVEAARKEYAAARSKGAGPGRDCDDESRALGQLIPNVQ